ncbi:hypothetical protein SO802_017623 [Lithocarpus litseifolius]|uniref:Aminotransferase-like plant mobile domain-containing protein n=1 Tax=Lithocarpus litseifolius TaxID=425828 RepID=A0AAW2CLY1_9ROSI
MSSSSNGPSFLTFHSKKYDPSFEWNDEEGLLQDSKTHASYSHMDIKLGGKRIRVNDSLTANEIKKLLGVVPSKIRSKNVPLSWLCENITKYDIVAKGTHLGSTVNLCYLGSLRNIEQIKNYDWGGMAYAILLHFMTQLSRRSLSSLGGAPFVRQVWMYEYFGVGPEIREEVNDIFPRFLRWLPKHCLSTPCRLSLEIWRLVIDNLSTDDLSSLVIFKMCLNPWVGCQEYNECERALELNSHQALFECGHGWYWYLGDQALPQVQHVYPPTKIPVPSCPLIWLADLLANKEITEARVGLVVSRVAGTYSKFIRTHLQGFLAGISAPSSEGEEEEEGKEEEIHSPHHVDVNLVEGSMQMIGVANSTRITLEERTKNLDLENRRNDPQFYASQEGNTEGGSSKGGSRRSSRRRTQSPNDV